MPGRKTIMVDETIWNKIDDYKHDRRLRSIGDAISSAVESVTSKKYYAGIHALYDNEGTFYHVVESLGKTEEEAIRRMIEFEAELEPEGDELRPESIPPASETDIDEEGHFIVECTEKMYLKGLLRTNVNRDPQAYSVDNAGPFYCHIKEQKNGELLADIDEHAYYVAYIPRDLPEGAGHLYGMGDIVGCGDSELIFADYNDCLSPYWDGVDLSEMFNPRGIKVIPCTPRLYEECHNITLRPPSYEVDDPDFYLCPEFFCRILGGKADTTPYGKFYAVITPNVLPPESDNKYAPLIESQYYVLGVGDTANKAAQDFTVFKMGLGSEEYWGSEDEILWKDVYPSGERIGKYGNLDVLLVECTVELYCAALASCIKDDDGKRNWDTPHPFCEIEGEVGERVARKSWIYLKETIDDLQKELEEKLEENMKELEEKQKEIVEMVKTEGEETEGPKQDAEKIDEEERND